MPRLSTALKQAYDVKDFTFNALMQLKTTLTGKDGKLTITRDDAQAIANLTRSHDVMQERVRILRGKPLPGTLRPKEKTPKKRRPRQVPMPEPEPMAAMA